MLVLELPWPPSINSAYHFNGSRRYISRKGIEYRSQVASICHGIPDKFNGLITLSVCAYPPDKRVRDIDNILKFMIDCLVKCKFFEDDQQVNKIIIERMEIIKGGKVCVTISDYEKA